MSMTEALAPFHLALPVDDLESARDFYCGTLGLATGRTAERWIDLDFFGHQVTLHLVDADADVLPTNAVDGDAVPARHFGVILDRDDWDRFSERLTAAGIEFLIAPKVRFAGEVGEQATMFFRDPCGNALEFKSFRDPSQLFAT